MRGVMALTTRDLRRLAGELRAAADAYERVAEATELIGAKAMHYADDSVTAQLWRAVQ